MQRFLLLKIERTLCVQVSVRFLLFSSMDLHIYKVPLKLAFVLLAKNIQKVKLKIEKCENEVYFSGLQSSNFYFENFHNFLLGFLWIKHKYKRICKVFYLHISLVTKFN
jgi:hypothetical protein